MHVPRRRTEEEIEAHRLRLEDELKRLEREGEERFDELWTRAGLPRERISHPVSGATDTTGDSKES